MAADRKYYEGVLADLEADMATLAETIATLKRKLAAMSTVVTKAPADDRRMDIAKAKLRATQDSGPQDRRKIPREIQPYTTAGRAIGILRQAGKPMHLDDIVAKARANGAKMNKNTLAGAFSTFANTQRAVYRSGPNIYGLIEWKNQQEQGRKN